MSREEAKWEDLAEGAAEWHGRLDQESQLHFEQIANGEDMEELEGKIPGLRRVSI